MTKGCKIFQEIMQLNKVDINRIHVTNTITIDDFIDRFCSKLGLNNEDTLIIKHISYLLWIIKNRGYQILKSKNVGSYHKR